MTYLYRHSLGQDHHRYREGGEGLSLGGHFLACPLAFEANSDGDVLLHALCNAISGISCHPILGPEADRICATGEKDSRAYVRYALEDLQKRRPGIELVHASFAIEASRPRLYEVLPQIRSSVATLLHLPIDAVACTATTGEGLTGMGRGEGMAVLCSLTCREPETNDPAS